MGDLLKKAIVEARVLRDVAIDNAKTMLLESLDENAEGILSAKLQQEMEGDEDEIDVIPDEELEETEDPGKSDPQLSSTDKDVTPALTEEDEIEDEEEDLEFENILKELDDEMEDDDEEEIEIESLPGISSVPDATDNAQDIEPDEVTEQDELEVSDEEEEFPPVEENDEFEDDEEINIEELLGDEDEEDEEEITEEEYPGEDESEDTGKEQQTVVKQLESVRAQNMRLKKRIVNRNKALKTLTSRISEINLFNHKLAHTTKLFKKFNLSSSSKMKIIETFDRAKSVREVKLVYAALYESHRSGGKTKRVRKIKSVKNLNESASRSTGLINTSLDKPTVLTEGKDLVGRFDKLVNYNK